MQKSPEAYRTISEAAEELGVEQHVLRFWETKFPQLMPLKRQGGRRFYRPEDMKILGRIHSLLKDQGFTIKGAQKALRQKKSGTVMAQEEAPLSIAPETIIPEIGQFDLLGQPVAPDHASKTRSFSTSQRKKLTNVLEKLQSARNRLQSEA